MSEKCEAFPKQTGVLQKHNFNNKLDIFLTLVLAEKGIYKYNDKELSEMTEKRFDSFENKQEMYDLLEKQAIIIEDLEKENELLKKDNQRQKTLRNKHWREIQARANGYNFIMLFFKVIKDNGEPMDTEEVVDCLNEQQDKITELEKNFEDLVNWSSEIAKRNVLLDEKIGRLQQENKELKNKLNKGL